MVEGGWEGGRKEKSQVILPRREFILSTGQYRQDRKTGE